MTAAAGIALAVAFYAAVVFGMTIVAALLAVIVVLFVIAAIIVNVIDMLALLRLPYRNRKRKP